MLRLLALLVLFAGRPAVMDEGKTPSGPWSASPMQSVWNVGDWGEACGPKPGGDGAPGGTARIVQKSGELFATRSVGSRATLADDQAGSRRTTFVAVLGGAALILGLIGLVLVLRGRRGRRELGEAPPEPVVTRIGAVDAPERTTTLVCPTCREEYPTGAQFCASDGNRLVAVEAGSDSRGPTGGVCPTCGQGFDPGVSVCPRHYEELVPVAVWVAREEEAPTGSKICPVCGTQSPADGRFCGSDGAALVPVN